MSPTEAMQHPVGDADLNSYVTEAPKFTVFRFDIEFDQIRVMSFFLGSVIVLFLHSIVGAACMHTCVMIYPLQCTFHTHSVLCLIKLYL